MKTNSTSRWVELCLSGASKWIPYDLSKTGLSVAIKDYLKECKLDHKLHPFSITHYVCRTKDMSGPLRYEEIVIDLDTEKKLPPEQAIELARAVVLKLLHFLARKGVKDVAVYFSGSKGFHIHISGTALWPLDDDTGELAWIYEGNKILGRVISALMEDVGIPKQVATAKRKAKAIGYDPALYNFRAPRRLAGFPNLNSQKRFGKLLYKTLMPAGWERWSFQEILDFASVPRRGKSLAEQQQTPYFAALWADAEAEHAVGRDDRHDEQYESVDEARREMGRTGLQHPPCIRSVRQGALSAVHGARNTVGIAVCSYHATVGDTVNDAIETMKHVATAEPWNVATNTRGQWQTVSEDVRAGGKRYGFGSRACGTLRSRGATCTSACPFHARFNRVNALSRQFKTVKPTQQNYSWPVLTETDCESASVLVRDGVLRDEEDQLYVVTPGGGKSYGGGEAAALLADDDHQVIYCAPTRLLLAQEARRRGKDVEEREGRTPVNCQRVSLAGTVAEAGWSGVRYACQSCPAFEPRNRTKSRCAWWQQWASTHPYWAVTHAHLRSGYPQLFHKPALALVDEDALDACLRDLDLRAEDLRRLGYFLPLKTEVVEIDGHFEEIVATDTAALTILRRMTAWMEGQHAGGPRQRLKELKDVDVPPLGFAVLIMTVMREYIPHVQTREEIDEDLATAILEVETLDEHYTTPYPPLLREFTEGTNSAAPTVDPIEDTLREIWTRLLSINRCATPGTKKTVSSWTKKIAEVLGIPEKDKTVEEADADTILFRIWTLTSPRIQKGWPGVNTWPVRELVLDPGMTLSTMSLSLWHYNPASRRRPLRPGDDGTLLDDGQKEALNWVCDPALTYERDRARHRYGLSCPIPKNFLRPLSRALGATVEQIRGFLDGSRNAEGAVPVRLVKNPENGDYVLQVKEFSPLEFGDNTRVVALDATANAALARRITGRELETRTVRVPIHKETEITQITEPRLPRSSLTARSGRTAQSGWVRRVLKLARMEHQRTGKKVLVISHTPFVASLRNAKPPDWLTLRYYGNVRGESLEEHETCILVGAPYPPREEVHLTAAALWEGEDLDFSYVPEWRPYFDVKGPSEDGKWWGSVVEVPKDPRVRAVWSRYGDNELYQALHRVRPIRAARRVYILTSHPLRPEWQVPVQLVNPDELFGRGTSATDVLTDLAEEVMEKEGWVSRDVVALLTEKAGNSRVKSGIYELFVSMPIYFSSLYSLGIVTNKSQQLENEGESSNPPSVSPSTLGRWWKMWTAEQEIHEVRVNSPGRGAPLRDQVVGDLERWKDLHLDHIPWGVTVSIDGEKTGVPTPESTDPAGAG